MDAPTCGRIFQLCAELVGRIAVIFAENFNRSLSQRQDVPLNIHSEEKEFHDESTFNARHSIMAICCIYDYGFLSSALFVQVVCRVLGDANSQDLCEFRIELLILLLRLGGGKLRQDDSSLFSSIWKEIHTKIQQRNGPVQQTEHKRLQRISDFSHKDQGIVRLAS